MQPSWSGFGLSEEVLRDELQGELIRAMRAEGDAPTIHAIAHAIARVIALDHLRIAEQLSAAGVEIDETRTPSAA